MTGNGSDSHAHEQPPMGAPKEHACQFQSRHFFWKVRDVTVTLSLDLAMANALVPHAQRLPPQGSNILALSAMASGFVLLIQARVKVPHGDSHSTEVFLARSHAVAVEFLHQQSLDQKR